MEGTNYWLLFMAAGLFFGKGMNSSLLAPFFPNEAMANGLSLQLVSIIMVAFDLAKLVAIIALSFILTPSNQVYIFLIGASVSASFCVLLGYVPLLFEGHCLIAALLIVQVINGCGASMLFTTGNPIFVNFFPGREAKVTSLLEASMGAGLLIGPAVGSMLYSIGGFLLPFTLVGSVEFIITVVSAAPLVSAARNNKQDTPKERGQDSTNCSLTSFCRTPTIVCACIPTLTMAAASGCISVTLASFLQEKLGIGSELSGYYFLCFGSTYTLGAFLVGFLGDKGYSPHSSLIFTPLASAGYVALSCVSLMPMLQSPYTILLLLGYEGFCHVAAAFVPAFRIIEKIALLEGFRELDNVRLTTTNLLMFTYNFGRVIGAYVFGGILSGYIGFHAGMLAVAVLILVSWHVYFYPLAKLQLLSPSSLEEKRSLLKDFQS